MKKVVVASGKGGTGKTTLTALFAYLAAQTQTITVADADVEASNLSLALNVEERECEAFKGGRTARIDPVACTACGRCAEVCRFDAVLDGDGGEEAVKSAGTSYRIDPWLCEGCGFCSHVCPVAAVSMVEATAGSVCVGESRLGPITFGCLHPGEDLSGRLVTEVRSRATELAESAGADLMLIDGPPGIGCPVIAALTNTDFLVAVSEPTVSGVHDLSRLVRLSESFDLPVGVVLNKADLSAAGAEEVRRYCTAHGLRLLAEIPFDPQLSRLLLSVAEGREFREAAYQSRGVGKARLAWQKVEELLERGKVLKP